MGWTRTLGGICHGAFPVLYCLGICGCATWDDITSREFKVKNLFAQPDPYVVLRESTDGDARAKAMRRLKEPSRHGGSAEEQDAAVMLLTRAASTDSRALCRLAAIGTLADYKDPRAVAGLKDAFYQATAFPPEMATRIQCQSLAALGKTKNPEALELLVIAVKQPPAEGADLEKQQVMDVRVAAARALANFRDPQVTDTLVQVMRTDKDIALRDRAHESLVATTGKDLPPTAKAWEDYIQQVSYQKSGDSQGPPKK